MNTPEGETDPAEVTRIAPPPLGAAQLAPGDILGERFVIVQFLARGGMGEVYEAADRGLQGKHVALKTLRPEIAEVAGMRPRFEREVLIAREVVHRNVCPTYNLFTMDGPRGPVTFLEMKLIRGESLAARIKRQGKLPHSVALEIARRMADGLDAAHAAGVIHRDFKPGNVMLQGPDDELKVTITDFGISRLYDEDHTLAEVGQLSGTLAYMAPELLPPESRPASPASDIYAFGLVLHEMLTGERPSGFKPGPELPREWSRVISGCLEREPAKRFQSAGEAMSLLEATGSQRVATVSRGPSRRTALEIGGAAAIAATAGVWYAWPHIDALIHRLPEKRFVALMAWPPDAASSSRSLLTAILDVIANRLMRAESDIKNLLIIRPADVREQSITDPKQVVSVLGANLVLAASLRTEPDSLTVMLRVLDAAAGSVLRERRLSSPASQANRLPERASIAAASLLQIRLPPARLDDRDELQRVSPAAYQAFTAAEDARKQPNDAGLDQAIAKYQEALEANSNFGLAYATLSIAYARKYRLTHDAAVLRLADRNSQRALAASPNSSTAVFSRALVYLNSGKTEEALQEMANAERMDPGNPEILMQEAVAFDDLNQAPKAEAVYRRLIQQRPNYWAAYNDLGTSLASQGKLESAAASFEEAAAVAPRVALPIANAGSMYLLLSRRRDAVLAFEKSIAVAPNEFAYTNLANIAFEDKNYGKALTYYEKACGVSPKSDFCWRNIGDCYQALGNRRLMSENYARAADLLSEKLTANPRRGDDWMTLAFYHAKLGRQDQAKSEIRIAEEHGATRVDAQFVKAQALAALGKKQEALDLILKCLDRGLSPVQADYAMDLKDVRADLRYRKRVAEIASKPPK